MQPKWYRTSWCHKITALGIIASYFILLIFINDTTYIWATLALIFVLFVTTFSCTSNDTHFLLQLRGTRVTGITNRAVAQNDENQEQIQAETRIWMTDIPPSYSFVMADIPPQTPPPSYGSAILMFPPPYMELEIKPEDDLTEGIDGLQLRRLSISTQVSVSSAISEAAHLGGITFSTQVSVISGHSEITPDMALRARFFISRQSSMEDGVEENNTHRAEKTIAETSARLLLLSRQFSREDSGEEAGKQQQNKLERRAVSAISRQFSREDGGDGIDLYRQTLKMDLRKRVLLSTQASREELVVNHGNQGHEQLENERSISNQLSMEELVDCKEQKTSNKGTLIFISQQNSQDVTYETQRHGSGEQIIGVNSTEIQASGSNEPILIPGDIEQNNKAKDLSKLK